MAGVCIGSNGELLVEFICTEKGGHNLGPAAYMGPFLSGALGIFIDQAARIAKAFDGRAMFAGAVGDGAFCKVILGRLKKAGVDQSLTGGVRNAPTGSTFFSYNNEGSRDFVSDISHLAAAQMPEKTFKRARFLAKGISVLHFSGSVLGDPKARVVAVALCEDLFDCGISISIDSNIHVEFMNYFSYLIAMHRIMALSRRILPTDADAAFFFPDGHFSDWSGRLLTAGAQVVVLKRGQHGCIGRDAAGTHDFTAHPVSVVDPTGAGDCFCATLLTFIAAGQTTQDAVQRASAAGALVVSKLGAMKGNSTLVEIDLFLKGAA